MEYLIAVDLEGVRGVVGVPYKGFLRELDDYNKAIVAATEEINTAARALFDNGATKVAVWDNHGGGGNLDFSKIDSRVTEIVGARENARRMDFVKEHNFAGIIYIGYHSREGTLGGVLAHTFNSTQIQYAKINGRPVGELDIDSYIAATYNMAPLFVASDDKGVEQMQAISPKTVGVITKYGKSRNQADFRDDATVLSEIYEGVAKAIKSDIPLCPLGMPVHFEVRYTRMEFAAEKCERAKSAGIPVQYGEDAHTLQFEISAVNDMPYLL